MVIVQPMFSKRTISVTSSPISHLLAGLLLRPAR